MSLKLYVAFQLFEMVTSKGHALPLEEIRFAPVVSKPSKTIALGLNNLDHVKESKRAIPEVIHFLSRQFTLLPGDVILTGTTHGVGAFRGPSIYLKDGDVMVVEIEKVGRLVNPCKVIQD